MQYQLKTRQICLFFVAFLPVTKIFMLPSVFAKFAENDMWISCLCNIILDLAAVFAMIFACRKADTDFFGLLKNSFGNVGSKIILSLYVVYFFIKAIMPINEQKDYIEITFYATLPNIFTFVPFFLISFYISVKKIRVIGRCADVLWAMTSLGFLLLVGLSVSNVDIQALLPFGVRGAKSILSGSYSALSWYGDSAYLMFLIGQFAYKKKDGLKIFFTYLLASFAILLFMILFYCIFTSTAHRQIFSLTEISKYSSVIINIGRFDYIGILLILFSSVFSMSMPLYFASLILSEITGIKKSWISALIINGGMFVFLMLFSEFFSTVQYYIFNYAGIYFLILGNLFPLFTPLLKTEKKKNALYQN